MLRNEIRLITISGADDRSKSISCELEHVSLDEPPPYKALSYCWGNPHIKRIIQVNGHDVQFTENLEAALRELRCQGPVCLWVDALCINQADFEERGRQVLRMGAIYATASETIAWLGSEADNSRLALDLIHILSRADVDGGDVDLSDIEEAMRPLYQPSVHGKFGDHWAALQLLYDRPYWRRIWIIQEIAFAPNVLIRCGSQQETWENIAKATIMIPTAGGRSRISVVINNFRNIAGMGPIITINILRGLTQEAEGRHQYRSLLNVLTRSNNSLATIPSDKIYGILAITKDAHNLVPAPDYKLSAEEVCRMTTTAIIRASQDLDIICYGRTYLCSNLPSWVPDWTKELPSTMIWNKAGDDLFNATGSSVGTEYIRTQHIGNFLNDGLVLEAQGFVFDVINGLSAVELSFKWPTNVSEHTEYGLVQPDQDRSPYRSEAGIFEALWKSLVLGSREYLSGASGFLNSLYVMASTSDSARLEEEFTVTLGL
ncbi:hypothetical protein MMC12_005916 [Toensbergia leucococca]|nr:hypothetical protein [Toensbergia leucococca]